MAMNDDALRSGSAGADLSFEAAYRLYRDPMQRTLVGLLPAAEAEQVVQDVFFKHWKQPERFDPARGSLRRYLMVKARSHAIDVVRSEVSRRRRERADPTLQLRAELDFDGTRERLRDALASLPREQCEAVVQLFFTSDTYVEAARRLGLPEGTFKGRVRLGLLSLRRRLERDGAEGVAGAS